MRPCPKCGEAMAVAQTITVGGLENKDIAWLCHRDGLMAELRHPVQSVHVNVGDLDAVAGRRRARAGGEAHGLDAATGTFEARAAIGPGPKAVDVARPSPARRPVLPGVHPGTGADDPRHPRPVESRRHSRVPVLGFLAMADAPATDPRLTLRTGEALLDDV